MYDIFPIIAIAVGVSGLAIVIARKMPVLAQLPEEEVVLLPAWLRGLWARLRAIPISRIFAKIMARILDNLQRYFLHFARVSERSVKALRLRTGEVADIAEIPKKFLARIQRRRAYLEEERKIIEYIAGHPQDLEAYRRLADLYILQKNMPDARAALEQILKFAPDDEDTIRKLQELRRS